MKTKDLVTFCMWGVIAALVAAPLTLLYVDSNILYPYVTGKAFAWRTIIHIGLVLWAIAALFDERYRISLKHPLILAVGVWLSWALLTNVLGINPYLAFWSSVERMDGYISLLYLFGYLVLLIGVIRERAHFDRFLGFLLSLAFLLSFVGWGQDKGRVDSTLGNPIYLASVALFGIFIAGYKMVSAEKIFGYGSRARIIVFAPIILAFVYTIFRTGTRGALLGLVAGGFVSAVLVALLARKPELKPWRLVSLGLIVFVVAASALFITSRESLSELQFVQDNTLLSRLMNISDEDRTTKWRLANWNMALEGAQEKPLLGWGQEGYTEVFTKYYDVENLYNAEQWYDRVHNVFLDQLVFHGVPGLALYVLIFIIALFMVWRSSQLSILEKSVMSGLIMGYLAQNIVAFDALVSGIYLYAILGYIIIVSIVPVPNKQRSSIDIKPIIAAIVAGALVVGSVWWINYSVSTPKQQLTDLISYLRASSGPISNEQAQQNLVLFNGMMEEQTFASRELTTQIMSKRETFIQEGVSLETQKEYLGTLIARVVREMEVHNEPTKYLSIFGTFLGNINVHEEAALYLDSALSRSPNKPLMLLRRALLAEKVGDYEQAEQLIAYTLSLAPEYKFAQQLEKDYERRKAQR